MSIYRVTPKRGKWIVLRKEDRKTMSNFPFATKTEAKQFMANLDAAEAVKENKINQVAVGGLKRMKILLTKVLDNHLLIDTTLLIDCV